MVTSGAFLSRMCRTERFVVSGFFCKVDDKHVPLYRVVWISDVPHFCGREDCLFEGCYEIRLEQSESVWGSREDRDKMLAVLEQWQGGIPPEEDREWEG